MGRLSANPSQKNDTAAARRPLNPVQQFGSRNARRTHSQRMIHGRDSAAVLRFDGQIFTVFGRTDLVIGRRESEASGMWEGREKQKGE
jgi:hypothetical protein